MALKNRVARNAYMRDYHARNPLPQRARVARRNAQLVETNRAIVVEAKSVACMDCGATFAPYVMDFDHIRGRKLFDIGNHAGVRCSPARLLAEIAKCDVVCANCHRVRTHGSTKSSAAVSNSSACTTR